MKVILLLLFVCYARVAGEEPPSPSPQVLAQKIRAGDEGEVLALLARGLRGDTIVSEQNRTTALMVAAVGGHEAIIKALAKKTGQLDAREDYLGLGETALMKAIIRGGEGGAAVLLAEGADPRLTNAWGWNALHFASARGFSGLLPGLIRGGCPVNAVTREGYTALHLAARHGHLLVVEVLLTHGGDRFAKTKGALSPGDLARLAPWPMVEKILSGGDPGRGVSLWGISPDKKLGSYVVGRQLVNGVALFVLRRLEDGANPFMEVGVAPALGGRLVHWKVGPRQILKPVDPLGGERGGGVPILFPTPNEVRGANLMLGNASHPLRNPALPRPMTMHGYAPDALFAWNEPQVGPGGATFSVHLVHHETSECWAAFPRSNSLTVVYWLHGAGLRVSYHITNSGKVELPVGFGLHPYWAVGRETHFQVQASHDARAFSSNGLWVTAPVDGPHDFRLGQLAHRWPPGTTFLFGPGSRARLIWLEEPPFKLAITADPELGYLALYKPGPGVVCVENQGSAPDAHRLFGQGQVAASGLRRIPPGGAVSGWVDYKTQ